MNVDKIGKTLGDQPPNRCGPPMLDSLEKSAQGGDPKAQFELGEALWKGSLGAKADKIEAIKLYRESAENNYFDAILKLATIHDYEPGGTFDLNEAFRWYKKAAELSSPYAQYCVGHCYARGHGVAQNDVEAAAWYRKSALQRPPGFSAAQHALGSCYLRGVGVPQDYLKAVYWLRKAADQELAVAEYDIGNAYRLGTGLPQDFEAAASWYEKAAKQGHALAQYNLGVCYYRGMGVARSHFHAVEWYRKAAGQGQVDAQRNLLNLQDMAQVGLKP